MENCEDNEYCYACENGCDCDEHGSWNERTGHRDCFYCDRNFDPNEEGLKTLEGSTWIDACGQCCNKAEIIHVDFKAKKKL